MWLSIKGNPPTTYNFSPYKQAPLKLYDKGFIKWLLRYNDKFQLLFVLPLITEVTIM